MRQCPDCSKLYPDDLEACVDDGAPLPLPDPLLGTVLEGNYRIEAMLGKGGMGAVYRATQLSLDRTVAFKIILSDILEDTVALERFKREALAVARLRHPNIISIFDYGVAPRVGAYIVMEYIEGRSLKDAVKREGRFRVRDACDIMRQVCAAVGVAHEAGIIHRDLKPHNIMIRQGTVGYVAKVLDFGLAKVQAADMMDGASLTAGGALLGTPMYMSPEQCSSMPLDARSDLYSLGCVFYELLAGQPPFADKAMAAVLVKHLTQIPKPPSSLAPDLPPSLDVVLAKALAKDPEERYQTAAEMIAAIDAAVPLDESSEANTLEFEPLPADRDDDVAAILRLWSKPAETAPEATPAAAAEIAEEADAPDRGEEAEENGEEEEDDSDLSMVLFARELESSGPSLGAPTPPVETTLPSLESGNPTAPAVPGAGTLDAWGAPKRDPNPLPIYETSFVGRERELAEALARLEESRLVTLTGPGGIGKTRLAVRAAEQFAAGRPGGTFFVEFPPLMATSLVPQKVASALGLVEEADRPLADTLREKLAGTAALVVFDNCEHLVDECAPLVAAILDASPRTRVVVASREALGLSHEVIWQVPPLGLPSPEAVVAGNVESDATALFVERTPGAVPADMSAVARICHQLGGIPLAIELAAARTRTLPAERVLSDLKEHFRALTGGGRTTMVRSQTLRAALGWSMGLLDSEQRALARRLSVFVGGWTGETAAAVCDGEGLASRDVPELLDQLASLGLVVGDGDRYRMLDPVRQSAWEALREAGEDARMLARHRDHFLEFARAASAELSGPERTAWMHQIEADLDNLRAALQWSLGDPEGSEAGADLCRSLLPFWELRGYAAERRAWLDAAGVPLTP